MSKTLEEQMEEVILPKIPDHVEKKEQLIRACKGLYKQNIADVVKVAQIYALEQQIQLLEKIQVRDRFRATYHDLQHQLKVLKDES